MLYDTSLTTVDLERAHVDVALVPIGAVEQHSVHLPLGTDWLNVDHVAHRVAQLLAKEMDVYLLPAWPFSLSQCHGPMPGTVWLRPRTLASLLRDIVLSLYDQGIHHIAVINGHGGNFVLGPEIRELNTIASDLIVIDAGSWRASQGQGPTGRVTGGDIHAGAGETATQLYLNPEHVRPARVDYAPPVGREFLDYAYMMQISPYGVWGRPGEGTAEAGEQALERLVAGTARYILQAFDQIASLRGAGER